MTWAKIFEPDKLGLYTTIGNCFDTRRLAGKDVCGWNLSGKWGDYKTQDRYINFRAANQWWAQYSSTACQQRNKGLKNPWRCRTPSGGTHGSPVIPWVWGGARHCEALICLPYGDKKKNSMWQTYKKTTVAGGCDARFKAGNRGAIVYSTNSVVKVTKSVVSEYLPHTKASDKNYNKFYKNECRVAKECKVTEVLAPGGSVCMQTGAKHHKHKDKWIGCELIGFKLDMLPKGKQDQLMALAQEYATNLCATI